MRHRAAVLGQKFGQRLGQLLGLLIVVASLSGCFTGKRPSVVSDPFPAGSPTGDPAIDQVLAQLDANNPGPYTAEYTVLTKFGNTTRTASVAVDQGRRSVTVGSVRFLTINNVSQTCLLDGSAPCSTSIDPARISDTQVTPDFYAIDAAKRLRRDAVSKVATPVSHVESIGGQSATCVDVPLTGGTSIVCVLKGGPLARFDDAAVSINLTQFVRAADQSLFATTK
ncbi:MAG: hypothetical protein ACXVIH_11830 [Ilumatobacteraceae bacterium]